MIKTKSGFTIVELLIVIVVIAILAAISIVTYRGIQQRAQISVVSNALSQASKKIKLWQIDNVQTTPPDLVTVGVNNTSDVIYQYSPGTSGAYCITATKGAVSYKITEQTSPTSGGCAGHGQGGSDPVTNLVLNPNAEGSAGWGTGGAVDGTYVAGFSGSTSAYRMTRSTTGAAVSLATASGVGSSLPYSTIITLRSNIDTTVTIQLRISSVNTNAVTVTSVNLVANQPQVVKAPVTSSTATYSSPRLAVFWSSGGVGDYVDATRAFISAGSYSGNYGDGNTSDWIWNGSTNNATSTGPSQ